MRPVNLPGKYTAWADLMAQAKAISEQAEELEFRQMQELGELMIYRSQINKLADGEWDDSPEFSLGPLKQSLMGEDPRLPQYPRNRRSLISSI